MNRHDRRRTGLTALAAATLLVAAACSSNGGGGGGGGGTTAEGEPVKGGTLNMLGDGDIIYMDPNVSYYSVDYSVERMWTRQLFTFPAIEDKVKTAAPDMATEIPTEANGGISADGLTYTINLRPGIMWNTSPEREVTAGDVVRGVKRTCNPSAPFGGMPNFQTLIEGLDDYCNGFADVNATPAAISKYIDSNDISGVSAPDDKTVVFKLTRPATYFVDMLTQPAFSAAPEEVMQYLPGSQQLGQNQISNGPYQVDSWNPTKSITLSRNPAWDPSTDPIRKAYVDKININETTTQESVQQQLQTGTANADLPFGVSVPPSKLPQLMSTNDPLLTLGSTDSSNPYIVFNNISPNNNGALADVKVRQALSYAINRDNIIQVYGGPEVNTPLTHVLPEGIDGSEDFDLYPYDPEKAKQLLQEAGVSNLTLKHLYRPSSEGEKKLFVTLQQDLSKAGVKIEGVPVPDADFYGKYLTKAEPGQNGVWDTASSGWGPDWYGNAALSYFAPLFNGKPSWPPFGSNFGFYESKETDALIEKASSATDLQTALDTWAEADRKVMEDAAFFPLMDPKQALYHAEQVNNAVYIPTYQNYDPTNVWLSENMQGG